MEHEDRSASGARGRGQQVTVGEQGSRTGEQAGGNLAGQADVADVVLAHNEALHGVVQADAEAAKQTLPVQACSPGNGTGARGQERRLRTARVHAGGRPAPGGARPSSRDGWPFGTPFPEGQGRTWLQALPQRCGALLPGHCAQGAKKAAGEGETGRCELRGARQRPSAAARSHQAT